MTINAGNITAVMAVLALAVTLLAAFGGGIYHLNSRFDHLATELDSLAVAVDQLPTRDEFRMIIREEMRRSNQETLDELRRGNQETLEDLRRGNQETLDELRRGNQEMLDELRRNSQRLLHSLDNHTHDAEPRNENQPQ